MSKELHKNSRIYVAGHKGLVGSAIVRKLQTEGFDNLLLRTHQELELTDQNAVKEFFETEKPEFVILAAARVGGIYANNTYPADFIFQNIAIQTNVIHEAKVSGVKRLLFLGSSCIYPRDCPQPMKEEYLLSGPLEATNRPYAIAKISGIEMCWSYNRQYDTQYMAVMPTNVYGPEDNYDLQTSHVLPALIRKFHEAKVKNESSVNVWGTGEPRREFIHSKDLADACIHLLSQTEDILKSSFLNSDSVPLINIGCGTDQTISELAYIIKNVTGFEGDIRWDTSKPDGTPQKLLDVSRMSELGWDAKINLDDGIALTYENYVLSLK
ncbi:MAG: GDP-L-fucose synthase [Gammaproteobacteria bacterium]|nr:MAG: GDP-L-fucose synthase [Gammaproteobacteria bacterium]RKZ70552.1 MAG: GDP-L-fucose synthase [Gammaproteobacteria bacterium]